MKGTGVSPGIALGRVSWYKQPSSGKSGLLLEREEDVKLEVERFRMACSRAVQELVEWRHQKIHTQIELDILETQLEFLADPQLEEDIILRICVQKKYAMDAIREATEAFSAMLLQTGDEYLAARTADLEGISGLMIRHLNNEKSKHLVFDPDTILFADDLTPLDTLRLDLSVVTALVTSRGSLNSHTAILARSRGIPAVCGCGEAIKGILDGMTVLVNGNHGEIILQPDIKDMEEYFLWKATDDKLQKLSYELKNSGAITTDGRTVTLMANASGVEDVVKMVEMGGAGIGLLRTEFLFMQTPDFPDEEKQFQFYREVVTAAKGRPVIIRTLDAGGDKQLPYLNIESEPNPFMGYRAIRYCLDHTEVLKAQMKAILRASACGKCSILLPMISNLEELQQARKLLEAAKTELAQARIKFDPNIHCGIMIETPGAALISDILAREADFFSLGTNDLCQYTLAVDRMNDKVSWLYQPFHPAMLRLIQLVVENGHRQGIQVGMCGELAGDPLALPILLGLGLDELSVNARQIPVIKKEIIHCSQAHSVEIAQVVLQMGTEEQILKYLKNLS